YQSVFAPNEINYFSARQSLAGIFKFRCPGPVCCRPIGGVRFRAVRVTVPGVSVLQFWKAAQCRRDSIFPSLLPSAELGTVMEPSDLAAGRCSRGNRVVHPSFA